MAMVISKSLVGPRKAGNLRSGLGSRDGHNLRFAALGRGGPRAGHSLRDSSGPGDRVYAVLVLVGAGFKPAQARAVSA